MDQCKGIVAITFAVFLFSSSIVFNQYADAHGLADQSNIPPFQNNVPTAITISNPQTNPPRSVSQSFTPSASAPNLSGIDMHVFATTGTTCNDNWTINIRQGAGIQGAILHTLNQPVLFATPTILHIDFNPPVPTPSGIYTVEIFSNGPLGNICKWNANAGGSYAGGDAWVGGNILAPVGLVDAYFVTYTTGPSGQSPSEIVGGKMTSINTVSLLLAGMNSSFTLIPLLVAGILVSVFIVHKRKN